MVIKTSDAIKFFNGVPQLAEKLGITKAAIYQWGETVPEVRAYQIHVLSGGALPPKQETAAAA